MLKHANETLGGKGELAAGGALAAALMFPKTSSAAVKGAWGLGVEAADALGPSVLGPAAAGAVGVYIASYLSSPEGARATAAAVDPGAANRARMNAALNPPNRDYLKTNPNLAGIGAPHVSPPPNVTVAAPNVDIKSTTTVTLDGASIAAAIVSRVEKTIMAAVARVTSGPAQGDHTAMPAYPDSGFMGP
jgi:hypothetical protein